MVRPIKMKIANHHLETKQKMFQKLIFLPALVGILFALQKKNG